MQIKNSSIIPGFNISMGITIFYISFIILLPLISIIIVAADMTWMQFVHAVFDRRIISGYIVSIVCSLTAAIINCLFGTVLAWVLVRYDFPGKAIIDGLIELPFAVPTAVAGISLASLYAPAGLIGSITAPWGIKLAYCQIGITIALVFVTIPFVVRTIQPILQNLDPSFEEAAFTLGAGRFTILRKVVLPELLPALLLGGGLAFARALGEYGSVIFIAGNMPYKSEIVPLLIMVKLQQFDYPQATAIAIVMLIFSFVIMLAINSLQIHYQAIISGGRK
ncbi:sulfate ABC transporter permease subunit CysT [Pectinatus brassicae]|uniref:Sulfate transport system permease protein CysT n=1 Tax=Pectinatus brassicae TaxID=862415 RepID=A0A840ULH2_9FIRM|nr:sulfate ABC transporter permease subunit CysT [Pectinatus brassicae]MBB5335092.1 sulfate transport system permease protein [Pectinatus brassicae]